MYAEAPLSAPISPAVQLLAGKAVAGRLTMYAGAGISVQEPTLLPGAARLATLLQAALSQSIDFTEVSNNDLLATADRVAAAEHGVDLLHQAVLTVADFCSSTPSYAHRVLAELIAEGAATVLTTNYDTCIEQSSSELLPVVVSTHDRLEQNTVALLKVHGCATRPSSLLVTTSELADPPLFAEAELRARLTTDSVVFVGLGSPADYVRTSLERFGTEVDHTNLTLVDPRLADWEATEWATILGSLSENQRLAAAADEFCDELLRAYVNHFFSSLLRKLDHLPIDADIKVGLAAATSMFELRPALWTLQWLRSALWGRKVGRQSVTSTASLRIGLAMSRLTTTDGLQSRPNGIAVFGTSEHYAIFVGSDDGPIGSQAAGEAARRIHEARINYLIPSSAPVLAICAGQIGGLGFDQLDVISTVFDWSRIQAEVEPDGLIDREDRRDHLIDGIASGPIYFVNADDLMAGV